MRYSDLVRGMVECLKAEETPLQAFCKLTKGEDGAKGIKRDTFEKEYTELAGSAFLRKARLRAALKNELKEDLIQAVMNYDPEETEIDAMASHLAAVQQNLEAAPSLLDRLETQSDVTDLRNRLAALGITGGNTK